MKKASNYFLILILLFLMINIYFYLNFHKPFPLEPYDLSVVDDHRYRSYPVYFVGDNRLVKSREYIDVIWRDDKENLQDVYFAQAQIPIEERSIQILNIPIDKLTVTPEQIYIYTELSSFKDSRYNRENFYLYLMSFVNTLTETSKNKRVYFILDGRISSPNLYGVDMNQGFSYDSSIVAEDSDKVAKLTRQFFREIYSQDYERAYKKLSREIRETHRLTGFTEAFESYVLSRNNEFPWDFLVEKDQDKYTVRVHFGPESNYPDEVWGVSIIDGIFIVDYFPELLDNLPKTSKKAAS